MIVVLDVLPFGAEMGLTIIGPSHVRVIWLTFPAVEDAEPALSMICDFRCV
jgi:hypothetical protein